MIIAFGVFIALLHAVAFRLADEFNSFIGVERRDTLLGKFKVIGAIEESLLRLGVGFDHTPLGRRRLDKRIVERRIAVTDYHHVFGAPPLVESVHIDVGQRAFAWVEWILGIVLRAQQSLLFRRHCQEQYRTFGRGVQFSESFGEF